MFPYQLQRVARRAAIGIGRSGTSGGNNSGDIKPYGKKYMPLIMSNYISYG
ncbi:P1 family peptidase [Aneurinibacillus migulanus]|nr:P1 family peptidase [Aneurinibacillus migulanus]MED0894372.1 P1 family peptidase [Aneurinibacillus migulanus]MED1616456.1 P1 family peptidase [Aneurinibacillus migulanus]